MVQKQRKLFEAPFGYREGGVTVFFLVIFGFLIELFSGPGAVAVPGWPWNVLIIAFLALFVLFVGIGLRRHAIVAWFGGIPLGLSLITALALLSMIGGIIPQNPETDTASALDFGVNRIFSSWPFALVCLLFIANLGLSFVFRLIPFKASNLQFILFHGGFLIALTAGLLGSSDVQQFSIPLYEGKETTEGYNRKADAMQVLPFSMYLYDFEIEEYAPMLGLYDPVKEKFVQNASRSMLEIRQGMVVSWEDIKVDVVETVSFGVISSGLEPVPADSLSGVPFAKVRVVHAGSEQTGWINPAGPGIDSNYLAVGQYALVLLPGSPKTFTSQVMFINKNGEKQITGLEVNKPFNFSGWKIYQAGYDEKQGRWSTLSVAEAVKDPWLPVVYFGFYLIMAGNLLFFWQGMKKSAKQ